MNVKNIGLTKIPQLAVINRSGIIYTDITKYICFPGVLSPVSTFKQKVLFS